MPLQLITAPSGEPLDLAEAQVHLKQTDAADSPLIKGLIAACRQYAETRTGRQLLASRWRLTLDAFPGPSLMGVPAGAAFGMPVHAIQIHRSPLIQVVSIQYLDMAGTLQTMPATDYTVDNTCSPPRITPVFGKIWPVTLPQIGAVTLTVDIGYCAPMRADATADTVTLSGWKPLAINDALRFSASGDATAALPVPLQPTTDYFVQTVVSPGVYKISATAGGASIDLTTAGVGTLFAGSAVSDQQPGAVPEGIKAWMLVRLAALYENREEVATLNRGKVEALPYIDRLLDPFVVLSL